MATPRVTRIGERFDRLTVIGFTKEGRSRSICRCDCGNEVKIRSSLLPVNLTNNCGCEPRGLWRGVGKVSLTYFKRVMRGAALRNMTFDLRIEDLWEQFQSQNGLCALTGLPIEFPKHTTDRGEASLDRIDNDRGYFRDNIQWVHKHVNRMKMDHSDARFVELCRLVVKHADRKIRKARRGKV